MSDTIHVWEANGHGKAPFRCIGLATIPSLSLAEANPEAYALAISELPKDVGCGTCRICGMPLVNNYIIQSTDGRKFVVGCECVNKTGDAGIVSKMKMLERKRQQAMRAAKREEQNRIAWAKHNAELDEQRKRNSGLTDFDVQKQKDAIALQAYLAKWQNVLDILNGRNGDFCRSMADEIRAGRDPRKTVSERGLEILKSICGEALEKIAA